MDDLLKVDWAFSHISSKALQQILTLIIKALHHHVDAKIKIKVKP